MVCWPGIDKESERLCKSCYGCQFVSKPASPEPISFTKLTLRLWQHLAADLIGPSPSGDNIFVVVDYCGRHIEVDVMILITSTKILGSLQRMFTAHARLTSVY